MKSREFVWIDRQRRKKAVYKFLASNHSVVTRAKYELNELLDGITEDDRHEEIFTDVQGEEII
jgi:antitoxin component of MazEF toxin-antitoxin module